MATPALYMRLTHVCQVALSAYGAYQSYIAITNLRTYEATTKKLAKWSDVVDRELHKTRTTQASGAIAVRLSYDLSIKSPANRLRNRSSHPS